MPLGAFKQTLLGAAGVSSGGAIVLLATQTASSDASLAFTSLIDSTYNEYIFVFISLLFISLKLICILSFNISLL